MNATPSNSPSENVTLDGSDQVAVRQDKLDRMREAGFDPFRANWDQTHVSSEALALLPERMKGKGGLKFRLREESWPSA